MAVVEIGSIGNFGLGAVAADVDGYGYTHSDANLYTYKHCYLHVYQHTY